MSKGKYHNGDFYENFGLYKNNEFDLAILDTPFGIKEDGRKKRNDKFKDQNGKSHKVNRTYKVDVYDDNPPPLEYWEEMKRISKYQIIFGCNYLNFPFKQDSSGRIIWHKFTGKNDFSDCEIAWTNLFNSVRSFEYMWSGFMQAKSISEPRTFQGDVKKRVKRIHPNQKPVELYRWILQLPKVQKEFKIIDTHVGSGSSLIACELEGFDYEGWEKSKNYYNSSLKRLQEIEKEEKVNLKLFETYQIKMKL